MLQLTEDQKIPNIYKQFRKVCVLDKIQINAEESGETHMKKENFGAKTDKSGLGLYRYRFRNGWNDDCGVAQSFWKKMVLEQHYVPGGFTHTFRRQGYEWDVGVHAVGEVTLHTLPGRILHSLTEGRLQWTLEENIMKRCTIQIIFPSNFSTIPKFKRHF